MAAPTSPRPGKPLTTFVLLLLGFSIPYLVPALSRYRLVPGPALERLLSPRAPLLSWSPEELSIPARRPAPRVVEKTLPVPLPKPRGRQAPAGPGTSIEGVGALASFYARLDQTRRGVAGAITRITHFGDSPLTGDLISGEARKRLQERFGDGGHGFLLPGRPWGWYGHQGITLKDTGWRKLSPLFGNLSARTGLSGVAFSTTSPAARTRIETTGTFRRVEVAFAKGPGGGRFRMMVDGVEPREVSTSAPENGTGFETLELPAGANAISIQAVGDAAVTLYGVVLERDGPGLIYDAVGANGGSVHFLTLIGADSWVDALARRKSDLVILNYGTNESGYHGIPGKRYEADYAEVISRVRRALPGAAILLMAPMDRGMRDESGAIVTMPKIVEIVEAQRKVARENGCAFFDTFTAVGGRGTMARWYEAEPRLVSGDFTHTTKTGSDRVARLLVDALEEGYLGSRVADVAATPPAPPPS